jgi:hypothetical protein
LSLVCSRLHDGLVLFVILSDLNDWLSDLFLGLCFLIAAPQTCFGFGIPLSFRDDLLCALVFPAS